jgi:hypothetical protein
VRSFSSWPSRSSVVEEAGEELTEEEAGFLFGSDEQAASKMKTVRRLVVDLTEA